MLVSVMNPWPSKSASFNDSLSMECARVPALQAIGTRADVFLAPVRIGAESLLLIGVFEKGAEGLAQNVARHRFEVAVFEIGRVRVGLLPPDHERLGIAGLDPLHEVL